VLTVRRGNARRAAQDLTALRGKNPELLAAFEEASEKAED
jgi:hypothetical protein